MGKIKKLSDQIWKGLPRHKVKFRDGTIQFKTIKQQAEDLQATYPWFTYPVLRDLRSSNGRYKEGEKEVSAFKKVFASELAYLEEGDSANQELEQLEKELLEMKAAMERNEKLEGKINQLLEDKEETNKKLAEIYQLLKELKQ